jgi:nucleoside-diphosphate-sugar epimerase
MYAHSHAHPRGEPSACILWARTAPTSFLGNSSSAGSPACTEPLGDRFKASSLRLAGGAARTQEYGDVKVVVTGGLGFLGRSLARQIAVRGEVAGQAVDALVLADRVRADAEVGLPEGAEAFDLDVGDPEQVAVLLDRPDVAVFHLASIVSAGGEVDFEGALRVNLDGTRNLLEACRVLGSRPRVVFASTLATFGGARMPDTVTDALRQVPQTTYGTTKAIGELLVNDYTRKGFVDGRSARLPTVVIRPGAPNAAASSFASAVFREPLNGSDYALPVGLDVRTPLMGERTAVECLLRLASIDGDALGDDRALNLPSISVTVEEMVDSLQSVGRGRTLGSVRVEVEPRIEAIVRTWPLATTFERAAQLGLPQDDSLDSIVKAYIADHLL